MTPKYSSHSSCDSSGRSTAALLALPPPAMRCPADAAAASCGAACWNRCLPLSNLRRLAPVCVPSTVLQAQAGHWHGHTADS